MVTLRPRPNKSETKTPAAANKTTAAKRSGKKETKEPTKKNGMKEAATKNKKALSNQAQAPTTYEEGAGTILASYLNKIDKDKKKDEVRQLYEIIRLNAPDQVPEEQGTSTLGFGGFDYKTKSGCSGRWAKIGIMTNKTGLSLFVAGIKNGNYLLESYNKKEIGKASVGKSCIRFKTLTDLNLDVIAKILKDANGSDVMCAA